MKTFLLVIAASLLTATSLSGQEATYGSFHYVQSSDPFDDTDRSYIFTLATEGDEEMSLAWKCMEDGLNVILLTGYMGGNSQDQIRVRYRFDASPPSGYEYWTQLSTNTAAFITMSRVPRFTAQAKVANRIVVEAVDPLDGETKRSTYSLDGFTSALRRLPCAPN